LCGFSGEVRWLVVVVFMVTMVSGLSNRERPEQAFDGLEILAQQRPEQKLSRIRQLEEFFDPF